MTRLLTACIKPVRHFCPLVSWWNIIASGNLLSENRWTTHLKRFAAVKIKRKIPSMLNRKHYSHMPITRPMVCLTPGCMQEMPYWPPRTVRSLAGPPGCGHMVSIFCPPTDMTSCRLLRTLLNLSSSLSPLGLMSFLWLAFLARIQDKCCKVNREIMSDMCIIFLWLMWTFN